MGCTFGISLDIQPIFALEHIRKQKKMTRKEVVAKSGVHVKTIEFLENEINDPFNAKISTLVKLAKALGCKVRDFYPYEKSL